VIAAATDSGRHWGKRAFKKYPGTITVRIYPPVAEAAQRADLVVELAQRYYGDLVDNSVR
jgi:1-acyl-sn-glycerol-3-phosphate acyltransferase